MKAENLSSLFRRVEAGDNEAAQDLQRVLKPVVSREVRRILQAEEFATPLGMRVHGMLAEIGFSAPAWTGNLDSAARAIAHKICGQTLSRLTAGPRRELCVGDTVWA